MAFLMGACQKENKVEPVMDEVVEVTFTVSADDLASVKGIGDADTYEKELQFYAYRNGEYLDKLDAEITHFGYGHEAKVTAKLVKGQDYDFLFWAQAKGASYYSIDPVDAVLTVDYAGLEANDEKRDAFWKVIEGQHIVAGMPNVDVVLSRPFAQINLGTSDEDVAAAAQSKIAIDTTMVELDGAAASMDLFTGETSNKQKVTFAASTIPSERLVVAEGTPQQKDYVYLSLNYILVADASAAGYEKNILDDFTITFYDGKSAINTVSVPNVPVRRNYRTNIIGDNVLTEDASFIVTIVPLFIDEYLHSSL